MTLNSIGKLIRQRRLELGNTQEDLAESSGLNVSFISEIECGKRNISIVTLEKISKALGFNLGDLFEKKSVSRKSKKELAKDVISMIKDMDYERLYAVYRILEERSSSLDKKDTLDVERETVEEEEKNED